VCEAFGMASSPQDRYRCTAPSNSPPRSSSPHSGNVGTSPSLIAVETWSVPELFAVTASGKSETTFTMIDAGVWKLLQTMSIGRVRPAPLPKLETKQVSTVATTVQFCGLLTTVALAGNATLILSMVAVCGPAFEMITLTRE
jgi:hypothetical protein